MINFIIFLIKNHKDKLDLAMESNMILLMANMKRLHQGNMTLIAISILLKKKVKASHSVIQEVY